MKRIVSLLLLPVSLAVALAQSSHEPHLVTRERYIIKSGDKFAVDFRYTPELNQTVTVEPDGFINLDPTGDVKVSGLTLAQATELITQRASSRLNDPKVTVTLKEFHKPYYVVAGEVKRPGRYDMDEPTTALQAILNAGGMDTAAQSSQVIVFRRLNADDDEVHVLDLHKVKKVQDLEHDLTLEPGDMILVPKDRIAKMDRIIRATNVGLYLNPGQLGN
jgi:polysaccharide export outer membrane protein